MARQAQIVLLRATCQLKYNKCMSQYYVATYIFCHDIAKLHDFLMSWYKIFYLLYIVASHSTTYVRRYMFVDMEWLVLLVWLCKYYTLSLLHISPFLHSCSVHINHKILFPICLCVHATFLKNRKLLDTV